MAKALFGHVGVTTDPRLLAEIVSLRARVRQLEEENVHLRAELASSGSGLSVGDELLIGAGEPVLT